MLFLLDTSFSYFKYFSAWKYFELLDYRLSGKLIDRLSGKGGQLLLIPSI